PAEGLAALPDATSAVLAPVRAVPRLARVDRAIPPVVPTVGPRAVRDVWFGATPLAHRHRCRSPGGPHAGVQPDAPAPRRGHPARRCDAWAAAGSRRLVRGHPTRSSAPTPFPRWAARRRAARRPGGPRGPTGRGPPDPGAGPSCR